MDFSVHRQKDDCRHRVWYSDGLGIQVVCWDMCLRDKGRLIYKRDIRDDHSCDDLWEYDQGGKVVTKV